MIDAAEDGIDLVLSDVVMPEMGGAELMATLWERHPEIGVILMSGYAPELGEATAYAENLAGWLQKPFNVNDLATTLANARRSIEP
jgi:DNA-binding NtrC family response regulator